MDDARRNAEVERIANVMVHDGVPADEQDASRLEKYCGLVMEGCGLGRGEAMELVYEVLLYRKMKGTPPGNILDKGGEFGAGFS